MTLRTDHDFDACETHDPPRCEHVEGTKEMEWSDRLQGWVCPWCDPEEAGRIQDTQYTQNT